MKRKRWMQMMALGAALTLVLALVGCAGNSNNSGKDPSGNQTKDPDGEKTYRVAYVADSGLDEYQWLTDTVDGLQKWADETDYIQEIKFVEATDAASYEPTIRALCEDGFDVIMTSFSSHADATKKLCEEYPEIYFGILDAGFTEEEISQYSNFMELGIERGYNSFIAGVVAASMSESGKVGFIGGADINAVNWILAAWQQGLRYVNPDITDYVVYSNTFSDPALGKEFATSLIEKGCDVLASSSGGTEVGICQACAENDVYYCAYDVHYYDYLDGLELGSARSDIAKMVEMFYDSAIKGEFPGGEIKYYGYEYGTVYFEFAEDTPVPDDVQKLVEDVSAKILSGEIVIDKTPLHK